MHPKLPQDKDSCLVLGNTAWAQRGSASLQDIKVEVVSGKGGAGSYAAVRNEVGVSSLSSAVSGKFQNFPENKTQGRERGE